MAPKRSSSYLAPAFPFTILARLVALAVIGLVLVWLLHFREGLAFRSDDKAKIFNVHPLLMLLGFVLISGEAIMAYKTVPTIRKRQKLFHLLLHLVAFVAGVLGIYAVFKFHHDLRFPHMYSLHSWLGLSTISLLPIWSPVAILLLFLLVSSCTSINKGKAGTMARCVWAGYLLHGDFKR
ncbi:probable ascorbate-specific transmembrane electron transporter 1 [Sesamum indicum]|uniref:Probable ascorbate-specific transmembrane electron transporter 1 n=1 Tax=Sesamum indicum TaxID=4182 RepID=A0A8M8V9F5_SESIN|nr:probable ascorbate-specific transmembrane electron transporter 1 [Sesamum indicum]